MWRLVEKILQIRFFLLSVVSRVIRGRSFGFLPSLKTGSVSRETNRVPPGAVVDLGFFDNTDSFIGNVYFWSECVDQTYR